MGFFASAKKTTRNAGMPSVEMLHRLECKACPLNLLKGNQHPHMLPTGSKKPVVYILGSAPSKEDDERGKQFVGEGGRFIRKLIPDDMLDKVRWSNVVRTRTPNGRNPEKVEIESCRPSIERDIAATKPKAIFGFGDVPLQWAIDQYGVRKKWRGRRIPVNINGHVCWYFSFMHPTELLKLRKQGYNGKMRPSELERATEFDIKRAFARIPNLPDPHVMTTEEAEANVELIPSTEAGLARLESLLKWAAKQKAAGVDYETFRVRPYADDAAILSAAVGTPEQSFAFLMDHPGAKWTKAQRKRVDELWYDFLMSPCRKVVHHLSFEMEWSAVFYGPEVLRGGRWEDTYNQAAVLDERFGDSKPGCLSLEFLILQYFGFNLKSLSPLNKKDLRKEPVRDVLRYNGMDAKFHVMLWYVQRKELKQQELTAVYRADLRKIPTVVLSQIKGVPIYQKAVRKLTKKYQQRVDEALAEIAALKVVKKFKRKFGRDFNPASNKDMPLMLVEVMGYKNEGKKKDSEGRDKYGTDEEVLKKIDHPLARLEIKRRKASKLLSTYILPYTATNDNSTKEERERSCIWPDGKIHPIYNQPGTISNRTSAEDPNVQNSHKRNPEAKEIRKQVRAPVGHLVVSFDYGQIQFRGVGMLTRDKKLVRYLHDDKDVHEEWTNNIAYAYPARVGGKEFLKDWGKGGAMKTFRGDVKNQWTFPSIFGAALKSRAELLKVPVEILKPLDAQFWREFSGIAEWHVKQLKHYHRHGVVRHIDGRLNRAPLSKNQVFNLPVQGIEAQIVMDAFCRLSELAERKDDLYFQPELEIHDDLTFILPESNALLKAWAYAQEKDHERAQVAAMRDPYVHRIVTELIGSPFDFINVPLTVECSVGRDLYAMDEVLVANSKTWAA